MGGLEQSLPEYGLSPAGLARRGEILERMAAAQRWRRRRRMAGRTAAVAAPVLLVAVVLVAARGGPAAGPSRPPLPPPGPIAETPPKPVEAAPPPPAPAPSRIALVSTDPAVMDRYILATTPPRPGTLIDDDELVTLLAEAGQPTGIIRTRGRVILAADIDRAGEPPRGPDSRGPDAAPARQG